MPLTDMEILQRAWVIESKGSGLGWTYFAVGAASTRRLATMVEEGMIQILWKHRDETAYALTEKGKGLVAVMAHEHDELKIAASDIIDCLTLIKGFDDLKETIANAIHDQKRLHFLLSGPPACAKSLFLTGVQSAVGPERSYLAFGSRTTAAGLVELLFENQPDILCMDEVDKMRMDAFSVLLGLMETGDIVETRSGRRRGVRLNTVIMAACNDDARLPREFLSRFALHAKFPPYTREEFIDVAEHFLRLTASCPPELARDIGSQVFDRELGDIRKVRAVWELMDRPDKPSLFRTVELMERYNGKRKPKPLPASEMLL